MKTLKVVVSALLLTASPVAAAATSVTLYLDGARIETEAVAAKGYLEVPLPGGVAAGSLRIRPLQGTYLSRVELVPARVEKKLDKELAALAERKDFLDDRMKALEVREEIYRAAAKSQSGKAPRKTKTNRAPLEEIRKGTEFAIAQLEGVFHMRRKTEHELKDVEAKLSALRDAANVGGSVARIWVAGKGGRVAVSYLQPRLKWQPGYDFWMSGDKAEVVVNALLPRLEKAATVTVVPALLSDASAEPAYPASPQALVRLFSFTSAPRSLKFAPFPQPSLSFSFFNDSGRKLPPGEATCYRQGEYLGSSVFTGSLPGEARELSFGKIPAAAR